MSSRNYVPVLQIMLINEDKSVRGAIDGLAFNIDQLKTIRKAISDVKFPKKFKKLTEKQINRLSISISLDLTELSEKPACNGIDCPKKISFG